MFRGILYNLSDDKAISNKYGFIQQPKLAPERRNTKKLCYLLVEWLYGTNTWEKNVYVKRLYPI